MLAFLDTEFTDFIDCELISLALVSDNGLHQIYLEVTDFDRLKCGAFVQSAIFSQLGQYPDALVSRTQIAERLRRWFATLANSVTIACDSQHDRDLFADVLDGNMPENFVGWLDLRPLAENPAFNAAMMHYHRSSKPYHHALHDANANRAGWLALQQLSAPLLP